MALKRLIAKKLPGDFYFNVHARTHKDIHVGFRIRFERVPCFFKECTIVSADVDVFVFFVDLLVNLNKAVGGKK